MTTISSGQTVTSAAATAANPITVQSGGAVIHTTVSAGGTLDVQAGGTATATLDRGREILSGGTESGATVASGGMLSLIGVFTSPFVGSDGNISTLSAAGSATGVLVQGGGSISVGAGAATTGTILASGAGGIDALEVIVSGGAAIGTTVSFGAIESAVSATTTGTIVEAGGAQILLDATAVNDTILAGGRVNNLGAMLFTEAAGTVSTESGTIVGNGQITQSGPGTLRLAADLATFSGTLTVGGGTLDLVDPAAAAHAAIGFTGDGTLRLDGPATSLGAITGMTSGRAIDMANLAYTSSGTVAVSGNNVTITEGGVIETFTIISASEYGNFTLAQDASGGTVLADSYVQPVIGPGATLTISAGQTSNGTQILSGGTLKILSGGTAYLTSDQGTETLLGGTDSSGTILNSGTQTVSAGGIALATTVFAGGYQTVASGGTASGTIMGGNGKVLAGGVISGMVLSGSYFVNELVSAGRAVDTFMSAGGLYVEGTPDGSGTAIDTVVYSGAVTVYSGGVTTGTQLVHDGNETVSSGGVASGTSAGGGGNQTVALGGMAIGSVIESAGIQIVYGTALNDTILIGANITTVTAGTLLFTEDAGTLRTIAGNVAGTTVQSGPGILYITGNIRGGTVTISGGTMEVAHASTISGATIQFANGDGRLKLDDRGVLSATISGMLSGAAIDLAALSYTSGGTIGITGRTVTVTEGGLSESLTIFTSGGLYNGFTLTADGNGGTVLTNDYVIPVISPGGTLAISAGQTVHGTQIAHGETLVVLSGGTAVTTTDLGTEILSGGTESSGTVSAGAALSVLSGGHALDVFVNTGGTLTVGNGGVVSSGSVAIEGSIVVSSGGAAIDTYVQGPGKYPGGGLLNILSGATATGTILSDDFASESVAAGATVTGTQVDNGGRQSVAGTAINDAIQSFGTVSDAGTLLFTQANGAVETIAGVVNGSGLITQSGPGTLDLAGTLTAFDGTVAIAGGVLELASAGAAGSAGIAFTGTGGTLLIEGTAAFTNTISGFVSGTAIDLAGLAYTTGGTVAVSGNHVTITQGGTSETLTIAGAATGSGFSLTADGQGGTVLRGNTNATTVGPGTTATISAGHTSSFLEVQSGGTLVVQAGGTEVSATIDFGGVEIVSGGTASATQIQGALTLLAGASASFITLSSTQPFSVPTATIGHGASSLAATVGNGTELIVAGRARFTAVNGGGEILVSSGGVTTGTFVSGMFSRAATELVASGGSVVSSFIGVDATETVSSGATATATTLSGGSQVVYGTALNDSGDGGIVDIGTLLFTQPGGKPQAVSVQSGGGMIVEAGPGTLDVGLQGFTGAVVISSGTVNLSTTSSSNAASIHFAGGAGTLELDGRVAPLNIISGFSSGGVIDLPSLVYSSGGFVAVNGDKALVIEGGAAETLTIDGAAAIHFNLAADATGGTELNATCFCPGTAILTPTGERPVESLAIGDPITTIDGHHAPIKWIGRRSYARAFVAGNPLMLPVRIAAGALADTVPHRDLYVSAGHAIYLDGALVPAWRLINGHSITQPTPPEQIDYIHIELHHHDILLAEGAAAETFLDDDCRGQFANHADYAGLYPDTSVAAPYAPRLEEGFPLQTIQHRLARRAGIPIIPSPPGRLRGYIDTAGPDRVTGWAQDLRAPEEPVILDILADGRRVARILANRFRQDLRQAGYGSGCHAFDIALPPGTTGKIEIRRTADGAKLRLSEAAAAA